MTLDPRGSRNRLPAPGAGFVWEQLPVVGDAWFLKPQSERAVGAFTTREGGVSNGPLSKLNLSLQMEQRYGDNPLRVVANRDLAGRAIGRRWDFSTVRQVHGGRVVAANARARPDADGMWTDDPGATLAVVSADCVLLLCIGEDKIAVAHAGWRGLLAGIVDNAVRSVEAREVFAGPAIGPCCFEVGPEVRDEFEGDAVVDDRHVDLWTAAEQAAHLAGVDAFFAARICTSCNEDLFFSHRRDGGVTGRQGLLARLATDEPPGRP